MHKQIVHSYNMAMREYVNISNRHVQISVSR